jgi:hypothetical protein
MKKSLRDFTAYLKGIMQEIPADYAINPVYQSIADEESIRNGVLAFRDFIEHFFDYIITNADLYDNPKQIAERGESINFTLDYPFLRNMLAVLLNIGDCGELNRSSNLLVLDSGKLLTALKAARITNAALYLRFLTDCGIEIIGVELDKEKPKLPKDTALEISYPDNPVMMIGLTVMAKAQMKTKGNNISIDSVFLRCDYKAIEGDILTPASLLKDIAKPFPIETQELLLRLHQLFMNKGFACDMENDRQGVGYFITYSYKNKPVKDIWIIKVTPDDCGIKIDAKHALKYADTIGKFPADLIEIIKNGDGCSFEPTPEKCKLQNTGFLFMIGGAQYVKCSSKCCFNADFWIPLTNLDLKGEKSRAIEKWVEFELSYLK